MRRFTHTDIFISQFQNILQQQYSILMPITIWTLNINTMYTAPYECFVRLIQKICSFHEQMRQFLFILIPNKGDKKAHADKKKIWLQIFVSHINTLQDSQKRSYHCNVICHSNLFMLSNLIWNYSLFKWKSLVCTWVTGWNEWMLNSSTGLPHWFFDLKHCFNVPLLLLTFHIDIFTCTKYTVVIKRSNLHRRLGIDCFLLIKQNI